jgi:hypothetical protein
VAGGRAEDTSASLLLLPATRLGFGAVASCPVWKSTVGMETATVQGPNKLGEESLRNTATVSNFRNSNQFRKYFSNTRSNFEMHFFLNLLRKA